MNSIDKRVVPGNRRDTEAGSPGFIWKLVALSAAFHFALVAAIPQAAEKFMLGDRALDRTTKTQALLGADSLTDAIANLFTNGMPGDYILFTPAYALAGPKGVMVQSIILHLAAIYCLYYFARRHFGESVARIASVAYALLPASLFHPQAFVSENITDPFMIFSVAAFSEAILGDDRSARTRLWLAAAGTAVLVFVRNIFLLWPLVLAALLWLARPGGRRPGPGLVMAFLAISYSLAIAWLAVSTVGERYYGPADPVGGLASNLYLRAERMAATGGFDMATELGETHKSELASERMSPGAFLTLVARHPIEFAKSAVSDATNIVANPGVAMVAGRYFGAFDLKEQSYKDYNVWREARDQGGLLGVARLLWQTSPTGFLANIAGGVAWIAFLVLALLGVFTSWKEARAPWIVLLLLSAIPVYIVGISCLTAGYTRWDHRSPAEFALAIFAAVGWLDALLRYHTYTRR